MQEDKKLDYKKLLHSKLALMPAMVLGQQPNLREMVSLVDIVYHSDGVFGYEVGQVEIGKFGVSMQFAECRSLPLPRLLITVSSQLQPFPGRQVLSVKVIGEYQEHLIRRIQAVYPNARPWQRWQTGFDACFCADRPIQRQFKSVH